MKKFGDVYLNKTVLPHVRRLLDGDLASPKLEESLAQFAKRMQLVEDYMNSSSFAAIGGRGLMGLVKDLRSRCEHVIASGGQRVPK